MSWVEKVSGSERYLLKYSTWSDENWSEANDITSSDSWFVNWADYPSVVAYSGQAKAAHMLNKIPGNTYSYNVNIVLNKDGEWSQPFAPHNDSTATEHGFASLIPLNEQELLAAWLDGRRTEDRKDEEYFDLDKAMTLRSAVIEQSGEITNRKLLDASVCDCCQTSMTLTDQGPFIAYRNRTSEEIRDIYYSRYQSGEWTEPQPVFRDNWKIGACPVNGPRVASRDSLVVVAWFAGAGSMETVKTAVSTDYGVSFNEPITVNQSGTSGRVDVEIAESGLLYISELVKEGDNYYLKLNEVNYRDETVNTKNVAEMSGSRRSGFPQMELTDGRLFFAWTDVKDDTLTQIKTASLEL
ncbi:hypothetical protein G3570_06900 [Balneolaceae bacterium YR4-1]|uniref:Exo-alpha-sialidase n=1 Tax=Halalkalibaculum roseum TaxID=2709311 RepID=A0A6M1T7V4_9BACT|nr:hypothetical protein [Halalkalibaculum roseum]NGP76353.1 hypothetical protein [Halalkalibaculum roseum]